MKLVLYLVLCNLMGIVTGFTVRSLTIKRPLWVSIVITVVTSAAFAIGFGLILFL